MSAVAPPWRAGDEWERSATGGRWVERVVGSLIPDLRLVSTAGSEVSLASLAVEPVAIFLFPGTGTAPESVRDPDGLLGSGCTLQARGFAKHALDFTVRGARIVGVSTQSPAEQCVLAAREELPYPLLSDPDGRLADALALPTYRASDGSRVCRRVTLLAAEGQVEHLFHPVTQPRRHAIEVLSWLVNYRYAC